MAVRLVLARLLRGLRYGREQGWLNFFRLAYRKLREDRRSLFAKIDVLGNYDFIAPCPTGQAISHSEVSPKTINWFIPYFGKGSGGHLNIFRFVVNLEAAGYECRIVIVGKPRPASAEQAKKEIVDWFFPVGATIYLDPNEAPPAYFTFATSWQTAYYVRDFQSTVCRCYFVQDYEPWFYPAGSEAIFAEETYRFGFIGFTAGRWLAEKLSIEHRMKTHALGFSYDRELYRELPRTKDAVKRIFFYARPPTPRRAFELGLLVLQEVTRRVPDTRVVFAGWDVSHYDIPFPHEHAGLLTVDQLPALYSECDVALVLSCSNLSLLPLELMACGVPVVSNRAPWTEWLLSDECAQLAEATIDGLAGAIEAVLTEHALAERLRYAGLQLASQTSWPREAEIMQQAIERTVSNLAQESENFGRAVNERK